MTLGGAVSGIKTQELDELSMANAASLTNRDPEYGILASRLAISNLLKMTPNSFSECSKIQVKKLIIFYLKKASKCSSKIEISLSSNK